MKSSRWLMFIVTLFIGALDVVMSQNMLQFGDSGTMEPGQPRYYLMADADTSNVGPEDELRRTQRSFWNKLFKKGLRDLFDYDDDYDDGECCYNYNNNNYDVGNGNARNNMPPPPPPPQQYGGGYDHYMAPLHPLLPKLPPLKALQPWNLFHKPLNFGGNRGGYGPQRGPPSGSYQGNAGKQYGGGGGGGGGNKNYNPAPTNYGGGGGEGNKNYAPPSNKSGYGGGSGSGSGGGYGGSGGSSSGYGGAGGSSGGYGGAAGSSGGYGGAGGNNGGYGSASGGAAGSSGGYGGAGGNSGGYDSASGGAAGSSGSYGGAGGENTAPAPAYESKQDTAPASYDSGTNTADTSAADYDSHKKSDSYNDNAPAAPTTYKEPSVPAPETAPAPESYDSDAGSDYNAAPEESYDSKPAAEPAAAKPGYGVATYAAGYGKQQPIIYQPIIYVSPQYGYGAASQNAEKEQYAEPEENSYEEAEPAAKEAPIAYEENAAPAAKAEYSAPAQPPQQQQQYPQQQQQQQQSLSAPCCAAPGCQCGMPYYGIIAPVYSPCHSCGGAPASVPAYHQSHAAHNAYVASPHYAQTPPPPSYSAPPFNGAPTSYATPTSYGGPQAYAHGSASQGHPLTYSAALNPAQALTAVSAMYTVIAPTAAANAYGSQPSNTGTSYSAPVRHSAAPSQSCNGASAAPAYSAPAFGCCGDPLKLSASDQPYRDCPELFANYNNQLTKSSSY